MEWTEKVCTKCHLMKPRKEFWPHRTAPSGYTWWCKACFSRSYNARYRLKVLGPTKRDAL